jgi:hypothetical protein
LPFAHLLAKQQAAKDRGDQHGEDQPAEQSEGDGPCHRFEEAAFDALQSEDREIGGDDDADGIKYRPLDFMRGFADGRDAGLTSLL